MNFVLNATKQLRINAVNAIKDLSAEQLHLIPAQYNNNLIWHLGHMYVSEQILCYGKSNTPMIIPESYPELFAKGTSPRNWVSAMDVKEVMEFMHLTTEALLNDYQNNHFNAYQAYTTSAGVTLSTLDEAITYSYGHENLHYGNILSMIKLVR